MRMRGVVAGMLVIAAVGAGWKGRGMLSPCGARYYADAAVLLKADREFDAATAARGEAGFSSFIAEDMTSIRANAPIVRGKAEFVGGWSGVFATPGLAVRWAPELARISDDGTLGFTVGTYTTTKTENGAAKQVGSGKYVTIWRKQADGAWKVTFDSGAADTVGKS